ncbi:MAG: putative succinylglutamate desuccinylase/aspartoacylase [Rhizobium sp.]|nr:putative succinylglutamate desuccinylase/aspartoacylase [Rhizobium sp.]
MQKTEIVIAGDTPGIEWRLPVLRFAGKDPSAPKTYIQAALHAGELPGVAALHFFIPVLEQAEGNGEILGDITIVPKANPIGAAQYLYGALQGRFEQGGRVNFNRDFPLAPLSEREALTSQPHTRLATDQLKRHLLSMAIAADVVLDLHCDDESVIYAYLHQDFWPAATDLAESFGLHSVFLSDGTSSAFEDAVTHAWRNADLGHRKNWYDDRISLTMEFRGQRDVHADMAKTDAEGIMSFLRRRGVVAGAPSRNEPFSGAVAGLDYVQMVNAPVGGTVLFEKDVGEKVKSGERLAVIVNVPGDPSRDVVIASPVDGDIVTRVQHRFVRPTDNLMKIASRELSRTPRKPGGGLED